MRARFFFHPFLVGVLVVSSLILLSGFLGRFTGLTSSAPADKKQKEMAPEVDLTSLFRPSPTTTVTRPKKTMPPVDLSYLKQTWGLECKSQRVETSPFSRGGGGWQLVFRLEFTRDVPNQKEMREQLVEREPPSLRPGVRQQAPGLELGDSALWFYFFDSENVMVYKTPPNKIEGEVTGVKGDAFRVIVFELSADILDKTQKIEVRPGGKVKPTTQPRSQ
jgi:hypothetical protein